MCIYRKLLRVIDIFKENPIPESFRILWLRNEIANSKSDMSGKCSKNTIRRRIDFYVSEILSDAEMRIVFYLENFNCCGTLHRDYLTYVHTHTHMANTNITKISKVKRYNKICKATYYICKYLHMYRIHVFVIIIIHHCIVKRHTRRSMNHELKSLFE